MSAEFLKFKAYTVGLIQVTCFIFLSGCGKGQIPGQVAFPTQAKVDVQVPINNGQSLNTTLSFSDTQSEDSFQPIHAEPQELKIDTKSKSINFNAQITQSNGTKKNVLLTGPFAGTEKSNTVISEDGNTVGMVTCIELDHCNNAVIDLYEKQPDGQVNSSQFVAKKNGKSKRFTFVNEGKDFANPSVISAGNKDPDFVDTQSGAYVKAIPEDILKLRQAQIEKKTSVVPQPSQTTRTPSPPPLVPRQDPSRPPPGQTALNESDYLPTQARGFYSHGSLINSVSLPLEGFGYRVQNVRPGDDLNKKNVWGTTSLVTVIQWLAKVTDEAFPNRSALEVLTLSKKNGGPLGYWFHSDYHGHLSHQNGLDVDVGYPTTSYATGGPLPTFINRNGKINNQIDAQRFWGMAKTLAKRDDVVTIFVVKQIKSALCEFARDNNDYPQSITDDSFKALNKMRHWAGHEKHFHLRLQCPPDRPGCLKAKPLPEVFGEECSFKSPKH